MKIGNREFDTSNHTYIMGILNITPDSFSDGGLYQKKELILKRVEEMIEEGCDIIDIGGESTRPGHVKISDDEEIERVTPVIELVKANFDIPISLDTYKSAVAKAGIEAGIDMVNDIWGLKYDGVMAKVIVEAGIPCCLMHNRELVADASQISNQDLINEDWIASPSLAMTSLNQCGSIINTIKSDLQTSLTLAETAGISKDKIILDPGIGFGKTYEENLYVLKHLAELKSLGYPCLLGASRKSVIGLTLDLPTSERLEGTIITTVMAVISGYAFVRVHDIVANKRSIRMVEAILNAK